MKADRVKTLRTVIQSAELLLTVSPQLGENIQRALGIKIPHLRTMPNPIPEDFFIRPSSAYSKVKEFARGRFIFAGWTNWRRDIKRLDTALSAFEKVHTQVSETCLVIAGPVPVWAQKMADDLEISSSVLFLGPVNRKEIKLLSYECDCCILTSDHETFGLPIIEAMAAGKPVVATKCGGPESIIVDAAYGRLVDRSDAEEFAKAMLEITQDYNTFNSSGIQNYCKETYGEITMIEKWKGIYRDLHVYDQEDN